MSRMKAARRRDDSGFTLTELIVTLAVLSLVMSVTILIIFRVLTESSSQRLTLLGLQQATTVEHTFTQYLRSATAIDQISPSGDNMVFTTDVGLCSSNTPTSAKTCNFPIQSGGVTPGTENVEASLCTTSSAKLDTIQLVFGLQDPTSVTMQCYSSSNPLPSGARIVQVFDIAPPTAPLFSFYQWGGLDSAGNPTITKLSTSQAIAGDLATTSSPPAADAIQAVGLDCDFLPAPGPQTQGYSSELGTWVDSVVFLRNANSSSQ